MKGDDQAAAELLLLVYEKLGKLAPHKMAQEQYRPKLRPALHFFERMLFFRASK